MLLKVNTASEGARSSSPCPELPSWLVVLLCETFTNIVIVHVHLRANTKYKWAFTQNILCVSLNMNCVESFPLHKIFVKVNSSQ